MALEKTIPLAELARRNREAQQKRAAEKSGTPSNSQTQKGR
ncbi:hypothetical protein [Streptomyces bacillaris]